MEDSGLSQLAQLSEINVDEEGVSGAKNFFEAKVGLNSSQRSLIPFHLSTVTDLAVRKQLNAVFQRSLKIF